ncbi:MAG: hypothetical protein NT002_03785 [candidate division Zixibacteria bacterium]|nr:hypothetical protein [candidate division Zixibacteria bacterium]
MMRRRRSLFIGSMIALMAVALILSCGKSGMESTRKMNQSDWLKHNRQDWFADGTGGGGTMVTWDNGGATRLMQGAQSEPANTQIKFFEEQGFRLAYQYSFIVEGEAEYPDRDSLISVEILILAMEMPGDSTIAAYVTQVSNPDIGWCIQSQLLSSVARDGFEMQDMGDYQLWLYGYMPTYSMNLYPNYPMAAKWRWKSWLKCSLSRAITGCGASSIICIASTAGYLGCLGLACGGSAFGSMLGCAADQLLR